MPDKNMNEWKIWEKAMIAWVKELVKWQKANPTRDWLQAMGEAEAADGSNPPLPPVPPPGTK